MPQPSAAPLITEPAIGQFTSFRHLKPDGARSCLEVALAGDSANGADAAIAGLRQAV
jgi:hypothetical protein